MSWDGKGDCGHLQPGGGACLPCQLEWKRNEPYQSEQFNSSEITRAVNTLSEIFNSLEFTRGTRGMAYIMMFVVFQHRISGHPVELLIEQLKSTWAMFDQLDKGLSDKDMSKDN